MDVSSQGIRHPRKPVRFIGFTPSNWAGLTRRPMSNSFQFLSFGTEAVMQPSEPRVVFQLGIGCLDLCETLFYSLQGLVACHKAEKIKRRPGKLLAQSGRVQSMHHQIAKVGKWTQPRPKFFERLWKYVIPGDTQPAEAF